MTAFFQDKKATGFHNLEDAMAWVDRHAARLGMHGHEAEAKGFAQIFNA